MSPRRERLHGCCPPPVPEPPKPRALELLGLWRLARLKGDPANANHAIAQLIELAERPRRRPGQFRTE